ncbi:ABC transporter ATP-binding protein [Clostridium uliginosum]|uniref:Iron complex transport system ATP-binding protein n=1 Tax=Clostridium uliginosum TaxID=119641 RepID=A0A1I1PU01_9CLOT|nr:ABC transporter ATP-binding protein [Clostridium uliginosum]SFD13339.1 iron complex transport system ATP-binding protein [Clostridium uliginosum]
MKLKIRDLNVELDKKIIVKDTSLEIKEGEFVGIIGPNGSGKSSLLKTVYGVNKQKKGIIYLNDKNLADIPIKEVAKQMGVLGQFNNIAFDMKVKHMVLMGRSPHKNLFDIDTKEDYEIVTDSLEKVNMLKYADRSFATLSGGEKQRVLLARALAQKVDLLILDEPTNHLDIKYQIQILSVVKSLGITVVVALHDLNLAVAYCDRLYVMDDGKIVGHGKPEEVLTQTLIKKVYEVDCTIHKELYPMYITFKTN